MSGQSSSASNVATTSRDWVRKGRCWIFGDDLILDADVMAFRFAIERITDPEILKPHLFEKIAPDFASNARPGDIIIAGRNFGRGHVHVQGFIAMKALGLGLLARSMPFDAYRAAVSEGLLFLSPCDDILEYAAQGDELEVNFETGALINHTRRLGTSYPPLDPLLRDIVGAGGLKGFLRTQLCQGAPSTGRL